MSNDTTPTPADLDKAKTFSQDDVNKIVQDRLDRQAKKFADYDDLKAKVQTYEATLSTTEKTMADLQATVADLSAKAAQTEREALVSRIARDHGVTDSEDIDLFLTGDTEEKLVSQAKRLASRIAADAEASEATRAQALYANARVSTEGITPPPASPDPDDAFALAIASALGRG